jgi:hypothetical protein
MEKIISCLIYHMAVPASLSETKATGLYRENSFQRVDEL